jgi:hypothetical protein
MTRPTAVPEPRGNLAMQVADVRLTMFDPPPCAKHLVDTAASPSSDAAPASEARGLVHRPPAVPTSPSTLVTRWSPAESAISTISTSPMAP